MEMLEEKAQDEAASKNIEAKRIDVDAGLNTVIKQQETSECGIQNAIVKKEREFDILAEAEKNICANFDAEGESKVEGKVLEDNYMNTKQIIDREINGNLSFDRQTSGKERVEKGPKILGPTGFELNEDPVLIEVDALELTRTPVISTMKAGTMNSVEEPFASSKASFATQVRPVMLVYETSATQGDISHDKGASYLRQDESKTSGIDSCIEAEKAMALRESVTPEYVPLGLQPYPFEEVRKRVVTLESQEASDENEGQTIDHSPRQKKQVGTEEVEPQEKYKSAGKGVVELESQNCVHEIEGEILVNNPKQKNELEESKGGDITANGACMQCSHSEQRMEEILRFKSLLLGKDQSAKTEAIGVANSDAYRVKHNCFVDGGVHEGQMPEELLPVNNDLQKDSTGETVSDDGWYILEKVEVQSNDPSTAVHEEKDHKDLPENGDHAPTDPPRNDVLCDVKVLSSLKVIVESKEMPGAQPVHALDTVGVAFQKTVAQEMSAPDIDDVLEKLASEFERQESLARSNS
ncbi:hypothetical protein GOP47_0009318 [Adiantum capillus-veneris]|uniref:Uncharacterized protein n=1 Tax=Adiantum capillus-veneris TaxID=13818 RepID=A0A9D4UWV5_ADICA|nr:hypothetical protein GOP47_0009318 [Adiantum capillus-veneris]